MGLLEKLWDDTVAGPRPETGLGRLRRPASFSFRLNPCKEGDGDGGFGEKLTEEAPRVTRSIMIRRPAGCPSPTGSSPPVSPFSGGEESNGFPRKSSSDAYERGVGARGRLAKSPSPPHEV
ncbi:Auxin-repressed 12.5 kDa protein [Apostasia shenzhenica]|uniref:Auxin-repressed 12.5 kDa protein n=1 Tax=Apostasia shenzhenica TaxID=1088818 RepID=A0A2I0AQ56_9ASPA|nr:Auxin-repressed 12.5 kDa protein [Apostasia shenzhenica]